ncbi:MAG: RagB/SusD family nutrient uptake outer membrane protein [Bacteroidota bacterium]|nr:RagB/SusD family nutrient uptake outer membrane protein [Bacteroidota bacterium]
MKKIHSNKIIIPAIIVALAVIYSSCKQGFLDKPPVGTLNQTILANENGVQGLLIGAYALLDGEGGNVNSGWGSACDNWTYGSVAADDAYKGSTPSDQGDILGLETYTANAANGYVAQKWATCYEGAQRANDVLRMLKIAKDVPTGNANEYAAEARFLRAHYHFELKKVFGNVPFVDETVSDTTAPSTLSNIDGSGAYVNIWPKIEADFAFAAANLPETQSQIGRANKWAAMAFLAKVYMFEGKYSQAKPLFDQLIASGKTAGGLKYALVPYAQNFNPATKNSAESVFAVQMSVNDGSATAAGASNGNWGDNLNFPYNGGPGACCGFFNPSQSLANAYKTDANGLPVANYNSGNDVSATTSPYTGSLDPRIDWTMGRPGIPYYDWGPHPGDAWVRDPGNDGHFSPKKNTYAQSQKGTYTSTENYWANTELTANNYNLMRYADLLLLAAETEVQVGSLSQALTYVNMVRTRAADPTGWVYAGGATYDATKSQYSPQTTPADNYNVAAYPTGSFTDKATALAAIQRERYMELGMEGHRFFDLVRWGIADVVLNNYLATDRIAKVSLVSVGAKFIKGKSELFPIPQSQIDILNSGGKVVLKQNPGY